MCGYILLEVENTINTATINPAHNSLIFKKKYVQSNKITFIKYHDFLNQITPIPNNRQKTLYNIPYFLSQLRIKLSEYTP